MLNYILHNLDRYPLDGVVHFELEIDYPFIHNVIDYMETECKRAGIQFVRIKPRKTWEELYDKCGFPTRKVRWCNGHYKLDAKRQLSEWLNEVGFYVVNYIGYCADEERRFNKRLSAKKLEIYPLAENGINEDVILEWAKTQPIFNNYYKTNKRCGCMYCPMSSFLNFAYLYKYYPENFRYMLEKMRETEELREKELGRPFSVISSNPKYNADYLEHIVKTKWLKKLNEILVQPVGCTVEGKLCILCAAFDTIFTQQFVPQRDSIMLGFVVGESRIEHVHEFLNVDSGDIVHGGYNDSRCRTGGVESRQRSFFDAFGCRFDLRAIPHQPLAQSFFVAEI